MVIGLLYIVYFHYIAARNVRDFGDLMVSSTLQKTPLLAVNLLLVLLICYVVHLGIEVLGRTVEVFIIILFMLGLVGNFVLLVSGNVDINNLRPILEHGWKPIVKTVFLETTFLPYGEMIVFAMLLPYLNRAELAKKVWLFALFSSGLILCWTSTMNIAVLGVDTADSATFPTLATISRVNLFEFIQRLDAIVVFTMLITVFFKASIFLYGGVIGIADLFHLKNHRQIILPSGLIIIYLSMEMASSFPEHLEIAYEVLRYFVHFPIMFIIPLCMLLVALIRNGMRKTAKSKTKL